jgi:hypothetical protein
LTSFFKAYQSEDKKVNLKNPLANKSQYRKVGSKVEIEDDTEGRRFSRGLI